MREPSAEEMIDYSSLLARANAAQAGAAQVYLSEELPYLWRDAYLLMTPHPTNISRIRLGTFEYLYDDLDSLEALGEVPTSATSESRLVGVLGTSAPQRERRSSDDGRLRGFIGKTDSEFGSTWDKGHYIGHELGGRVAGMEANVFIQRRALNRGWSAEGKIYRAMERFCRTHPGTFCFARPFYADDAAKPSFLEFGVLRGPEDLWVRRFDNRGLTNRDESRHPY
ncbi:MAG: hypothetical protein U0002_01190 [Thermoanaerobaculia bacterium]